MRNRNFHLLALLPESNSTCRNPQTSQTLRQLTNLKMTHYINKKFGDSNDTFHHYLKKKKTTQTHKGQLASAI